jgi:DHA2 family multidrug resistance protein-like MFS transporter
VAVLIALVFAGIAMAGTGLLVTQYLQNVLDYSPAASAVLFAPMGLGVAAGTMASPALAGRSPPACTSPAASPRSSSPGWPF